MPHLDDGMIHELLDGEIPSRDLPPITAHLAACAECRARLEQAQALMAEADELIETLDLPQAETTPAVAHLVDSRRPVRWVRPLAWAASLVIAAAGGYAARGSLQLVPAPPAASDATLEAAKRVGNVHELTVPPATLAERPKETVLPPPPVMRRDEPAAKAATSALADGRRDAAEPPVTSGATANRAEATTSQPTPAPSVAAAPPTAGSAAGGVREALSGIAPRNNEAERRSLARDQVTAKQLTDNFTSRIDSIGLPDAMGLLGGRIRLIEGAVPKRLESQGSEVRVIYPLSSGELVLAQRLIGGSINWRLIAPAGFPADSVEKLRKLVKE